MSKFYLNRAFIIWIEAPIPFKEAKCLMDKLNGIGWKHNILNPGVINDGSHEFNETGLTLKQLNDFKLFKQVGCKDLKTKWFHYDSIAENFSIYFSRKASRLNSFGPISLGPHLNFL